MNEKPRSCRPISDRVRCGSSGFTLLETLVALAIVAIGFAFAFAALPAGVSAQDEAKHLETAANLAQSLLEMAQPPLQGAAGGFAWHIDTSPLETASAITALRGRIMHVAVRWQEGAYERSIGVQSVRLGR